MTSKSIRKRHDRRFVAGNIHVCTYMFLETTSMIKPEGDDAIFGDEPKKLSSTPLSLQRSQTIFPNAIGLALDIDRGVPTLRSHNCIRIFDAWNISRKNTVNNRSTKERKYNSKLIMVRDYVLDR